MRASRAHTRAQVAILVALAWMSRNGGDVVAALDAAHRAVALARTADAPLELAHAQLVFGVLRCDVREARPAAVAFGRTTEALPQNQEEDLWLVLVKLGDIAAVTEHVQQARRAFAAAWKVADELGARAEAVAAGKRLVALVPELDRLRRRVGGASNGSSTGSSRRTSRHAGSSASALRSRL